MNWRKIMIIMLRTVALVAGRVLAGALEQIQKLEPQDPPQEQDFTIVKAYPIADNELLVEWPGTQMDVLYDILEEQR